MNARLKKDKVGIMALNDFKQRTMAIANGEYKPNKGDPKIWFSSTKCLANVLSEENQELLRLIHHNPIDITQ